MSFIVHFIGAETPSKKRRYILLLLTCTSPSVFIVIRYKVYSEQHARAGTNIQHVNLLTKWSSLWIFPNKAKSSSDIVNKAQAQKSNRGR